MSEERYYRLIKQKHESKGEDFTELFQTVLSVGKKIGLNRALKLLERCVIEKRSSWLDKNLNRIKRTGNPIDDAYRIFYEIYLGISCPKDGKIVEKNKKKIVIRWFNPCPVLEACKKLNLDTKKVCKEVYHNPTQIFLSRIHPRLKFDRNYEAIRPYTPYCEEIITLEG